MTMHDLSAQDVARFLQEHPDFFDEHADLFASMIVPHPYQNRAISLGERQIMTLRDKIRDLELRLSGLVQQATRNAAISDHLNGWCQRILAESDAQRLPDEIALGLAEQFGLQYAALRVWSPSTAHAPGEPVSEAIRAYADTLKTPYCGHNTQLDAVAWLSKPPASLAMVALRPAPDAPSFGLLVLGSDDPERFVSGMGTAFLDNIGRLASAALSRLG